MIQTSRSGSESICLAETILYFIKRVNSCASLHRETELCVSLLCKQKIVLYKLICTFAKNYLITLEFLYIWKEKLKQHCSIRICLSIQFLVVFFFFIFFFSNLQAQITQHPDQCASKIRPMTLSLVWKSIPKTFCIPECVS